MHKPDSCKGCPLYDISDGWILPEGNGANGVAILGEAGGYNEYLENLPFRPHAQAGSKLQEAFKIVGQDLGYPVSRGQFTLYNVVNCHPPGDRLAGASYEAAAISHCSSNVDGVYSGSHPRVTLALGNIPLKSLTGVSGVAEEKQSISHLRGYVMEGKYGLVVPSLHPSFIRRGNNNLTPLLVEDMKKALAVARGTFVHPFHKDYVPPRYQVTPGLDDANSFYYQVKDNPRAILTFDIETPQTGNIDEDERDDLEAIDIILCQFSIAKHSGIALPWQGLYVETIKKILELPNVKANHNTWNFDNPRIRARGVKINGKVHDTMWMFKHWHPRLPRGLQAVVSLLGFPFAWKHLYSSNLQWYGCADVDAVQWIIHALPELMQKRGVWRGYIDHVYNVHPIMERASDVGVPVNEEKRNRLDESFRGRRQEIHTALQKEIPDSIRNIKPARKRDDGSTDYGYIREPKIVREEFERYERSSEKLRASGKRVVSFGDYLYRKHNLAYAEFEGLDKSTGQRVKVERWAVIEDFKASSTQLIRYLNYKREGIQGEIEKLEKIRKDEWGGRNPELTLEINRLRELFDDYEVPMSMKTKRETTNKAELEEMYLNTGDKVLEMVQEIRSYDTNINNYIPNWKPSIKDGRVHPVYGFTAPQGQINSWRPNSQNVSKHTEFGKEFRGIIEAPTGYCFVEADKKSFHVATMGYCADDRDYIRFSQIDPHSILGSYIAPDIIGGSISLKWSDADILVAAKEFKKRCKEAEEKGGVNVRQALAKPTVLGNQLEVGPKKMQRQNRRFMHYAYDKEKPKGEKEHSAEGLQRIIGELFPKPGIYRGKIKERAFLEKCLVDEWHRIQYFYDVFNFVWNRKQSKWVRHEGDGARHPIAFRVQGTAFGMIMNELLECEREGLCEEHNFIVTIHDSLVFMPEVGKRDGLIERLREIMNRPCGRLVNDATGAEGLRVGVEIATGKNWQEWDKERNPEGMREI